MISLVIWKAGYYQDYKVFKTEFFFGKQILRITVKTFISIQPSAPVSENFNRQCSH